MSVDPAALTLANVLGAKKDAEETVLMALRRFHEQTGLRVSDIEMSKVITLTGELIVDIRLKVDFPN